MRMTFLVIGLFISSLATPETKQAYAVCEGRCLSGLKILPTTQLVAPMVNGKADYSKAVIYNIGVNVDHNLEKIEMR